MRFSFIRQTVEPLPDPSEPLRRLMAEAPAAAATAMAIRAMGGGRLCCGVRSEWFSEGESCLRAMLRDLRRAQKSVWLELWGVRPGVASDTVFLELLRTIARGVDVRLICDPDCRLPRRDIRPLAALRFRSLPARRSALFIDGRILYAGSMCLRDECIGLGRAWKTGTLRLEGDLEPFRARFRSDWQELTGQQISNPGPARQDFHYGYAMSCGGSAPAGRAAILGLVSRAEERLWIMAPRFFPNRALRAQLRLARASGVAVRIITSRPFDPRLTRLGAELCVADSLHTRICCADGTLAVIGAPSFREGLWLYGRDAVSPVDRTTEV